MTPGDATLPLRLYGAVGRVLSGPALARADRRLTAAGIAADRLAERRGQATRARPAGRLIWIHAASVGESLSALPLVARLSHRGTVLVTTGTGTSARIMADRLPNGAIHQFAPVDTASAVRAFLGHWRPDLGVFVESELWPRMILGAEAAGIPLALVNARMSDRSLRMWAHLPATLRRILAPFRQIVTQDTRTRDGLAPYVPADGRLRAGGNLKTATPPPDADPAALADWQARLGDRAAWTASSTHPGEDTPVLDAHAAILRARPDALCLLVPRHPERGAEIARLARERGFRVALRSAGEAPSDETQVYIADTIGETGLWYRVAPIVFLAGSFGAAGGHNPWEPVGCGAALLHGPNVANAAQDYRTLAVRGAARSVADAGALAVAVLHLLGAPSELDAMRQAARGATGDADAMADELAAGLIGLMEAPGAG